MGYWTVFTCLFFYRRLKTTKINPAGLSTIVSVLMVVKIKFCQCMFFLYSKKSYKDNQTNVFQYKAKNGLLKKPSGTLGLQN